MRETGKIWSNCVLRSGVILFSIFNPMNGIYKDMIKTLMFQMAQVYEYIFNYLYKDMRNHEWIISVSFAFEVILSLW